MPNFARLAMTLSALMTALALPAQSGAKAAARKLKAAVRAVDVSTESGDAVSAAVAAVQAFDGRVGASALLDAIEQLDGRVAAVSASRRKGLMRAGGSGRLKRSRYELRNLTDAQHAAADALAKMNDPAALRAMASRVVARGSAMPLWLRLQLAERMAELSKVELDWSKQGQKKVGVDTRIALIHAAQALGGRAGAACGGWLVAQLHDECRDVRRAAVQALSRLAWPGAIEPLIGRLERESGEDRERLLDALVVLTSQNPGASAASWQAWLKAEGAPFLAGERELSHGDASVRVPDPEANTAAGAYFGIEQQGESILYVFDNSLSMQAALKKPTGKGANAKDGAGESGASKGATRWQMCKQELRRGLRALRPEQRFNLVSFANKARSFGAEMQPATKENVERAIEWVDGLKLELQTNVYDALELAFQLAGRGVDDRYYAPAVDTMFFLSDGAPTIANLMSGGMTQD
ncbi:MAG: HEAT repeat domain-containing protein, partial [Planctomycetota bacterium]|nr:HEAT repeat domain-containing protein [Planctomycetota bacterium]